MRALLLLILLGLAAPAAAADLQIMAPPALAAFAERVQDIDRRRLDATLAAAGLTAPADIHVTLISEDDERARETPRWIVALALGTQDIVIFPARIGAYPYDSLESVLTHELVHLALSRGAEGQPLPRWFHEGVAVSVESGWGIGGDMRLIVAALTQPGLDDLARLFASESQLGNADAYLLATALVDDVRKRHGATVPGAIAARVAGGVPFARGFELETGESPDAAAARAWAGYRRWTAWLPVLSSISSIWTGILILACVAFIAVRRRRAERRRRWDEEDRPPTATIH